VREIRLQGDMRLVSGAVFERIFPNRLVVTTEDGSEVFDGKIWIALLDVLLSGGDPNSLAGSFAPEYVASSLTKWIQLGLVQQRPLSGSPFVDAFWDSLPLPASISPILRLHSLLKMPDSFVRSALAANGVTIDDSSIRSLILTNDYLRPELEQATAGRGTHLLAKPVGHTVWLGPLIGEESGICWKCAVHWLRTNRATLPAFWLHRPIGPPTLASLPSTLALAAGLVATAASVWAATGSATNIARSIVCLDTRTLSWTSHEVRSIPGCLNGCEHRVHPASKLADFVSPVTGIVDRMEVKESILPGYYISRAEVSPPLPIGGSRPGLKRIPIGGRGHTYDEARRSCLGEALERYSSVFQGNEPRRTACERDLGDTALSPASLFLFSMSEEGAAGFDSETPIEWSEVRSLVTGHARLAPSAYCYLWHHASGGVGTFHADSTGCAAGETLEQATVAALLELVERDALAIWWGNRIRRAQWPLRHLSDRPLFSQAADRLSAMGRTLELLDISTDFDIPVCVAISAGPNGDEPYFASAAGLNAASAGERALTELIQLMSWPTAELMPEYADWLRSARRVPGGYLEAAAEAEPPRTQHTLASCVESIYSAGFELYLLDLTRRKTGVPVVRVLAPGLRHPGRRRAPGRLCDLPVKMGWLAQPLSESELNPVVCPI
jgi:ribosomal protein S12 methylthiotransferase accessory factor